MITIKIKRVLVTRGRCLPLTMLAWVAVGWPTFLPHLRAQSGGPPVITRSAHNQVAGVGGQATFSVQVGASSTPLSYQWQFNGANVPGATNAVNEIGRAHV